MGFPLPGGSTGCGAQPLLHGLKSPSCPRMAPGVGPVQVRKAGQLKQGKYRESSGHGSRIFGT